MQNYRQRVAQQRLSRRRAMPSPPLQPFSRHAATTATVTIATAPPASHVQGGTGRSVTDDLSTLWLHNAEAPLKA
jgi:hypothetical protein